MEMELLSCMQLRKSHLYLGSSGQSSKRRTFPIVPFVPSIGEVSCFTRQSEKAWNAVLIFER